MTTIGDNIKRLRQQYGLSQSDIGKIVGVSDKAVSTWENDISEPKIKTIQILADYFGIKKSDLVEERDTPFADKDTMYYAMELKENPEMQALFYAAKGVSKDDLEMAIKMIEHFKKK